jgi:hypothetical protein
MGRSILFMSGFLGCFIYGSLVLPADEPVGEKRAPESEPKWDFKSKPATEAKQRFDQVIKDHRLAYTKAATDAEKDLLKDLKSAMKEATKAADLDDAIKIKVAIEHIEKHGAGLDKAPVPTKLKLPLGKWQMSNAQGVLGTYDFRIDGTVFWSEKSRQATGKAIVKDGAVIVIYKDDRTERLTLSGERMIVEHWFPSSKYPVSFPLFAYAERIK